MRVVNIHEAKTHLSRLVERAAAGEEIVIGKAGTPVARLVKYQDSAARPRQPGSMKGLLKIRPGFDDLDRKIEELFHGSAIEPAVGHSRPAVVARRK